MRITSLSDTSVVAVAGPMGPMTLALPIPFASGINAASAAPATTVTYLGSLYMCIVAHVTTGSFDTPKWQLLAGKGDTGPVATVAGVAPDTEGNVALAVANITGAAPLASPALTGTPTAPTPETSDDTTKIATTEMVQNVRALLQAVSEKGQASGYASLDSSSKVPAAQLPSGSVTAGRNLIDNGRFEVDQRHVAAEATVADNTYHADRWRYIGEASAALTSRVLGSDGIRYNKIRFTGTTDKGGLFQVIESADCTHLRGETIVLQAKLSVNNVRLGNMKMGIAEFTSTADATTGDPISAWGASGTTPTLAANWAWISSPANLNVTTTPTVYSVTGNVGASMNNLAVVIWNDDKTYDASDYFTVTSVQLEVGSSATPYEPISFERALAKCQRYFEKTYDHLVAPGASTSVGALYSARNAETTSRSHVMIWRFAVRKRAVPTCTAYSTTGAATYMRREDDSGDIGATVGSSPGEGGVVIYNNATSTAGYGYSVHGTAAADL